MKIFKNPKDEFIFTLVMLPVTIIAAYKWFKHLS